MKTWLPRFSRSAVCALMVGVSWASGPSDAGSASAKESEVRGALQQMFSRIRTFSDSEVSRLIMSETVGRDEAAAVLGKVREIRELLQPSTGDPMSGLSPPLATVRAVWMDGSDRATACVCLVRLGSMFGVQLAAYDVIVTKAKQDWRLTSVRRTTSYPGVG